MPYLGGNSWEPRKWWNCSEYHGSTQQRFRIIECSCCNIICDHDSIYSEDKAYRIDKMTSGYLCVAWSVQQILIGHANELYKSWKMTLLCFALGYIFSTWAFNLIVSIIRLMNNWIVDFVLVQLRLGLALRVITCLVSEYFVIQHWVTDRYLIFIILLRLKTGAKQGLFQRSTLTLKSFYWFPPPCGFKWGFEFNVNLTFVNKFHFRLLGGTENAIFMFVIFNSGQQFLKLKF